MSVRLLAQARGALLERVPEIVVRERQEDHTKRIGLVVERGRSRREYALARGTSPQLYNLKLLPARAATRQVMAAAMRATVGDLGCLGNECDARWRSHIQ
jgi:hypothetical protein